MHVLQSSLAGDEDFIFGRYSSFLSCHGPTLGHQVKFHICTSASATSAAVFQM